MGIRCRGGIVIGMAPEFLEKLVGATAEQHGVAKRNRLRGRFGALVFPGSRLLLKARSLRDPNGSHVHFEVTTPSGEAAIAEGYAFLSDEPVGS